ncbi:MAG TPA: aldo/keto reductase [Bryobacteraceae bacterium]|nr:aldo/keto reductase [Bryobacteraceae bacterium]
MIRLFREESTGSPGFPPATALKRRQLGRTGLMISEIGFGSWPVSGSWGGRDDAAGLAALRRAFDGGVNFVDTALIYGSGHSERLIRKALHGRHHDVFIATKIPPRNRQWPARAGIPLSAVFPLEYVKQCIEKSLRNLGRDALDLQQFHVWNPEWAGDPEWHRTIEWLKTSGKVRFVGISANDHMPGSVLTALHTGLVDCVQVIYNIFDQSPADELFAVCESLNIGVIARVPFDEGGLTGTITPETRFRWNDFRKRYFAGGRRGALWERILALKADLGGDEPLASIALRFCLSHTAVSTVIPGSRNARHVEQNLRASEAGALSESTMAILSRHRWTRNFYD